MACFVAGVIDGEKVRVRVRKVKARLLEADLLEVIQPSPHRIAAPCPVFLKCGGCAYQHIAYDHQLRIKRIQLREALRRLGGMAEPPVGETDRLPGTLTDTAIGSRFMSVREEARLSRPGVEQGGSRREVPDRLG